MMVLYIATSKNLAGWAAAVGVTKHVYKLGVTEGSADDAGARRRRAEARQGEDRRYR